MTALELYEFAKVTVVYAAFIGLMAFGFFSTIYIMVDTTIKLCRICRNIYRHFSKKKSDVKENAKNE